MTKKTNIKNTKKLLIAEQLAFCKKKKKKEITYRYVLLQNKTRSRCAAIMNKNANITNMRKSYFNNEKKEMEVFHIFFCY